MFRSIGFRCSFPCGKLVVYVLPLISGSYRKVTLIENPISRAAEGTCF